MGGSRAIKQTLQNRWMTLVASFFIMSCAGALYSFSIYSQKLKTALGYDQETVSTIGFFKDLGANIGIVAGILYDVSGAWLVLLLGAVFNLFGYMMAWAAVTGRIARPRVWQMCAYLWVGASSGAFASTAVIVTCVKNFPRNRGIVIGLLKGFVGLSGAMLTQIYRALYGEDPSSFMLVVAWFPAFVFVAFMFVVRPLPADDDEKNELRNFYVFLVMALALALFLMMVIVIQHLVKVPRSANQALMAVMILILALPVFVVVESEWRKKAVNPDSLEAGNVGIPQKDAAGKESPAARGDSANAALADAEKTRSDSAASASAADANASGTEARETWMNSAAADAEDSANAPAADAKTDPENSVRESAQKLPERNAKDSDSLEDLHAHQPQVARLNVAKRVAAHVSKELRQMPERGEDHTILQSLVSLDLWIVFLATTAGLGSGLMAIDNMGQLGSSLGYSQSSISTFVSLLSIWNFFGRVGFGFVSEICLQKHGIPRPFFLGLVLGILAFGHLYIAFAWPGALYLGSILIGMCFGAQMPVMFAIISEIFGLRFFGTLYNVGILASPLGTYLLSVRVAGHLYDTEAKKQQLHNHLTNSAPAPSSSSAKHDLLCNGSQCYRNTFFIMAGVCMFGCLISFGLAYRTRRYYQSVHLAALQAKKKKKTEGGGEMQPS